MDMTIDEAVKVIHKMLAYTDLSARANLKADMIDACHMAIDTMRKYQTMQEVLEKVWNAPSCMLDEAEYLGKIMETYRTVRY